MVNEDDVMKKIKEIEELTNFNIKKNICINCLDKLIKERETINNNLTNEINILTNSLETIVSEIESKDFSN